MKEIGVDEVKDLQLGILDEIKDYCSKNGLVWWLDYGTLIGAVRHHGYIPWDDDVDIGMPRKDYEQFINNFNKSDGRYKVFSANNDKNYPWSFAKVYDMNTTMYEPNIKGYKFHVFVDLYVYDGAPNDERQFISFQSRMLRLNTLHANQVGDYTPRGNFLRKVGVRSLRLVLQMFPNGYFWHKINHLRKKYNNNCELIVCYSCHDKPSLKTKMLNTIEVSFEDRSYPIPEGYHEHLLGCYSHPYYEYPPKEEQVNKHNFIAFMN